MSDTTIPATYAGGLSYSLILRQTDDVLYVRRDSDEAWKQVYDWKATPLDSGRVLVEINGDLQHGAPVFVWLTPEDWEKVKGMRG